MQLDEVYRYTLWKDKQLSDLSIEAEVDPDPINTDEPVTYTVTVQNRGPDRADDVKLTMKSISSLGLSLQQADLSGNSLSCGEPDSHSETSSASWATSTPNRPPPQPWSSR